MILDYFRAPKCEQCTGNRGLELHLQSGQQVFAVTDGVISFQGEVNRTKYLVLTTSNNRRITYGKILASLVRAGDRVVAGQPIAVSGSELYFGVRELTGSTVQYVDPMKYFASRTTNTAVLVSDGEWLARLQNRSNFKC